MKAKSIMIQGTGSSVGKSLLVTALCRIFAQKGLKVAPFKAQNMSLNSAITAQGHEIGRAQAAQAEAAGIEPSALMNPVLLKPGSDKSSQIIVNGLLKTTLTAREYYGYRASLKPYVLAAYEELAAAHDLVCIEGAGSPAEINLRENDLANMGMAELADAPVILVGDIDRGGVFASLYGTVRLLEPDEQARIKGMVINKFRGDVSILEPGLRQLEQILALPFLGVLPYWDIRMDEEDSLAERLDNAAAPGAKKDSALDIAVIRLPKISNHTDFAALEAQPDVTLRYVRTPAELGAPDWIILPGTKNTLADMLHISQNGLARRIIALHGLGVPVWGICGGFQMLGQSIRDPGKVESGLGSVDGLALLEQHTLFGSQKRTTRTELRIRSEDFDGQNHCPLRGTGGMTLKGYEIHMGDTFGSAPPLGLTADGAADGAVAGGGAVVGTYLHGLFDNPAFTRKVLNNLRQTKGLAPLPVPNENYADFREKEYDRLAATVEKHIDIWALERIIGLA